MSTVAQIIASVQRKYPRANDHTDADLILELNEIQDDIKKKLLKIKWENEPVISYSVADQKQYTLPTGCKPYNMIKLLVSQVVTGSVTINTVWDDFQYVGVDDNRDITAGDYYSFLNEDTAIILKDNAALATTNLEIKWFFRKEPLPITATTQTPDIETKYHDLFIYKLIQRIASIGDNPETEIADHWQMEYMESLNDALKDLKDKFSNAPPKRRQVVEYM